VLVVSPHFGIRQKKIRRIVLASLNHIQIIGNVGKEVEMRFTPSGKPVSTFSVGTNSKYKNSNGDTVEETEWFSIVTWGKLAELCNQYLHKGSTVYVEGRNKTRSWEKDGVKHYKTEVIAETVKFLDKVGTKTAAEEPNGEIEPEDIPFS
jgi:single-strand DNA-binding protein